MILIDQHQVLIAKSEVITQEKEGYLVGDTIYPYPLNLILIDVSAPESVTPQDYLYACGAFSLIPEPSPPPEEDRDTMLVDLDYRMTLIELGVN